jgi:methylmalonyl-CoA carboxyltransferase large subunit
MELMSVETLKERNTDSASLAGALGSLQMELTRLNERLTALEAAVGAKLPAPAPPAAQEEEINEELVLVIGAAIAAYLGVKPHIRQIRLLSGPSWSQQGRVTIQASHALPIRHN